MNLSMAWHRLSMDPESGHPNEQKAILGALLQWRFWERKMNAPRRDSRFQPLGAAIP